MTGDSDRPSRRIERGRALFNEGRFFEAHEEWEEAWRVETGNRRIPLQGLIQIAAALHKASRGESPGGCARLLDAGLARLGEAPAVAGLELSNLRADVIAFRQSADGWLTGTPGAAPPAEFPVLNRGT